jgi:hypothetical protein
MLLKVSLLSIVGLLIFPIDAFAYIDPGAGSALMSVIVGFFVAVAIALKTYWYKLKGLFSGRSSRQKEEPNHDDKG